MRQVRLNVSSPPTAEEKRQALELALRSKTLSRAEQLRSLLQHLCKAEDEGRHKDLTEYAIARQVLGRPEGYSPIEDSSVRTRAYELRHKLEKQYLLEAPGAPVRIVLPKGTYVPQYERGPKAAETAPPAPAVSVTAPPAAPVRVAPRWVWPVLAVSLLIGAAGLFAFLSARRADAPAVDPIVRQAWGPLAAPDANVLLCVATPLHLTVGPDTHEAFGSPIYPAPPEAYPVWRRHRPLAPGGKLGMVFTDNVIGVGTMNAVLSSVNTLRRMEVGYQIFPERVAPISTSPALCDAVRCAGG
jgi:hypothetical protein